MAQRFGRFWLHDKIGHGGMAEIFRATIGPDADTFAFDLVVKRLHPHLQKDQPQVDMFFTEADIGKFLKHPNIVQVYESGLIDGHAYIAMEYVWGYDLASLIQELRKRRLRFPSDLAIFVALQILRALDYVHRAMTPGGETMDIVHRDVTPSNIYVTFGGEVKLGDFGIARVSFIEGTDEPRILKGKVAYMPPEVLAGAPVDQQLDLWAVAVTLYEMLTARRLYEGVPEADIIAGDIDLKVEPVHLVNSDISERLSAVLQRAMSFKPTRRPATAMDFYRELKMHMRAEGIQVDATALSRFVSAVSGTRAPLAEARPANAPTGVFETPGYQVPAGPSPTQRFELVQRRRRFVVPLSIVGLGLVLFLGWRMSVKNEPSLAPAAAPVPEAASETEPPPADRARPAVPEEMMVEFADDFGEDADSAKIGPNRDSRFRALMHRGQISVQRKRFQAADDAFKQALELRPKQLSAMLGRANVLLELKRYREAEQLVRGAVTVAPRDARAQLLMGDVLWVLGRDRQAKAAYGKAVQLDPGGRAGRTAKRILDNL